MTRTTIHFCATVAAGLVAIDTISASVFTMPTGLTSLETVTIGNPANLADNTGYGAVSYDYQIAKYEITAGQYAEFLNAVAKTDTYALWGSQMTSVPSNTGGAQIFRSGSSGTYAYTVDPEWANRPVNYVSRANAMRFANWLHNGEPTGLQNALTTEDGSYLLNGATSQAAILAIARKPGASWALPTENEWYKAAYHDGVNGVYYDYPTGTDATPDNILPDVTGNNMNISGSPSYVDTTHYRTEAGEFALSGSSYGTFDQGGNLWEWLHAISGDGTKGIARGGAFNGGITVTKADSRRETNIHGQYDFGFRLVNITVPEPGSATLVAGAALSLMLRRRRR